MLPLTYDPAGAMQPETGLSEEQLRELKPRLEKARSESLDDLRLWHEGGPIPPERDPLDAAFIDLPERLLSEFEQKRDESELGRLLAAGNELAEAVDRLVVLGIGGSYMGFRALVDACLHPYHNELDRARRGGRPRVYFEGNNLDNDAVRGLLDLLAGGTAESIEDRWAIVVISKSGGTLETAVAFRVFLESLKSSCGLDASKVAERVVPVTGKTGRLRDVAGELGCRHVFDVPDGVGGRFSVLSPVGLVPAAVAGIDVVGLLRGAAEMNRRFREAPPGENPVLDYVGVCHLMETRRGSNVRVLAAWSKALETVGLWYDQLLAESLGKGGRGATPLTMVNTRDLHSRQQQHQDGPRDKLITNLIVERPNGDAVALPHSEMDHDHLSRWAGKTLPELMAAAIQGTNRSLADGGRPTADLRLPQLDAETLGQLFQMLMLATVVEGRLIGINPYGQPAVQGYKTRMEEVLRGD